MSRMNSSCRTTSSRRRRARSRLASQVERTGFGLVIDCPDHPMNLKVRVDQDGFTQILINLVDNAVIDISPIEIEVP